jgi:hypothetical protein
MTIYEFQQRNLQNGDRVFGKSKDRPYQGTYRGELDLSNGTFSLYNISRDKIETFKIEELQSLDKSL